MSKGSGRRKQDISEEELENAWNRIWQGNVNRKEDENGNKPDTKDSEEATG